MVMYGDFSHIVLPLVAMYTVRTAIYQTHYELLILPFMSCRSSTNHVCPMPSMSADSAAIYQQLREQSVLRYISAHTEQFLQYSYQWLGYQTSCIDTHCYVARKGRERV